MAYEQYTVADFLRRKPEKDEGEKINKRMKNVRLIEDLLSLFGTEQARENFLSSCKQYRKSLWRRKQEEITEKFLKRAESEESSEARIHNEIMDIIARLSSETDDQQATHIFSELGDRHKVAQAILDYLDHLEKAGLQKKVA